MTWRDAPALAVRTVSLLRSNRRNVRLGGGRGHAALLETCLDLLARPLHLAAHLRRPPVSDVVGEELRQPLGQLVRVEVRLQVRREQLRVDPTLDLEL